MRGKTLLFLSFSLLLVLGLSGCVGGLWAREPAAPGKVTTQAAVGTAFTYQGRLVKEGSPVNGTCDFQFGLWDDASAGAQVGSTQTKTSLSVSDGLFTVQLDFGSGAFQGDARWLKIQVRCPGGSGSYATLSPRQPLMATPYALYTLAVGDHDHWGETWTGTGTGLSLSGGTRGVYASGSERGVSGLSTSGYGVRGYSSSNYGVVGESTSSYGVYGSSSSGHGVYGETQGDWGWISGVYGEASKDNANGVTGWNSGGGVGVYGYSSSGYGVFSNGDYGGTGAKYAVVETKDYGWRHLSVIESPEVWFEDFGQAQLVEGQAVVNIEPIFAQTVNLSEIYHVFLTPLADCGLFVADKSPTSFTVQTLGGQTCNIAFDYRIIAKRLGYEDQYLEPAEDPNQVAQEIETQGEGP